MKTQQMKSSLILLLTALIWGVAFVAQSVGMDYVGPFTFNCVRSILGGLVLIPCIFVLDRIRPERKAGKNLSAGECCAADSKVSAEDGCVADSKVSAEEQRAGRRTLLTGGILCGVLLCVASNLQQIGIAGTSVGKAGFITALYIVIVPILGLFFRRKCSPTVWLGVLLAICGLYFLCINEGIHIQKGDFFVFLCALCFSVHILVIDHYTQLVDGVKMSCIQFLVAGAIGIIGMFIFEEPKIDAILDCWLPILYAGVLSSGVGYTLQIVAQKDAEPTVASLLMSLESVFAVIAGAIILHESMSPRELLGCAVIFAAVIIAQLPSKEERNEKRLKAQDN